MSRRAERPTRASRSSRPHRAASHTSSHRGRQEDSGYIDPQLLELPAAVEEDANFPEFALPSSYGATSTANADPFLQNYFSPDNEAAAGSYPADSDQGTGPAAELAYPDFELAETYGTETYGAATQGGVAHNTVSSYEGVDNTGEESSTFQGGFRASSL